MARVCVRHPFEYSDSICGACGQEFCRDCLVYPHGPRKLPLCVPCALAAGGVRAGARNRPPLSRREIKQLAKDRHREDKAMAKLHRAPAPFPDIQNPFTPGWALEDNEDPADDELFRMHEHAAGPPTLLPDTDLLAEAQAAAAAAARSPAPASGAPRPRPPSLADLPVTTPPLPSPDPVATVPEPPVTTIETSLGHRFDQVEDPPGGGAEADDEIEDDGSLRRHLPLPTLRVRHDVPGEEAEPSQMIAWLDEVFAPNATDDGR